MSFVNDPISSGVSDLPPHVPPKPLNGMKLSSSPTVSKFSIATPLVALPHLPSSAQAVVPYTKLPLKTNTRLSRRVNTIQSQIDKAVREGDAVSLTRLFKSLPDPLRKALAKSQIVSKLLIAAPSVTLHPLPASGQTVVPYTKLPLKTRMALVRRVNAIRSQIHKAVHEGDAILLDRLLKSLPDAFRKALATRANYSGDTPLAMSILSGSVECFNLLLEAGAVPQKNLLLFAIEKKRPEFVECLLQKLPAKERQELMEAADDEGDTPLLLCAIEGEYQSMELLLKAGANPLAINLEKQNFFHLAVLGKHSKLFASFLKKISMKAAKELANGVDKDGDTPLLYCAFQEGMPYMNLLLQAGADPLQTGSDKRTFLHKLVQNSEASVLKAFLRRVSKDRTLSKADYRKLLNAQDKNGDTALLYCIYYNTEHCLRLLLNAKADPFIYNHSGGFVYGEALNDGLESTAQYLAAKEPKLQGTVALVRLGNTFGKELDAPLKGKKMIFPGSLPHHELGLVLTSLRDPEIRKKILFHCDQGQYEELLQAFAIHPSKKSPLKKVVETIRQGKLVVFLVGWEEHGFSLVFRDGYLVICNRGEGSDDDDGNDRMFVARKISIDKVSEEFLQECLDKGDVSAKEGMKFFYDEMLKTLQAQEDNFCKQLCTITPKGSYANVCAYVASKAALRAALALLTKDVEMARLASKAWSTKQREFVLDVFKKTPSPFKETFYVKTLARMTKRLEKRKKKLLIRHLYLLKDKLHKKELSVAAMNVFANFCGLRQKKQLEGWLRMVCKKAGIKEVFSFSRGKMFSSSKLGIALKEQAIDLFIEQIDPDSAIRKKALKS